jgi:hypothetical protein
MTARRYLVLALVFFAGFGLSQVAGRKTPDRRDTPKVTVMVAHQGDVFSKAGELSPGVAASTADGVIRVDVRNGSTTSTSFYPVR